MKPIKVPKPLTIWIRDPNFEGHYWHRSLAWAILLFGLIVGLFVGGMFLCR